MGSYRCPRCSALVTADTPDGLRCTNCGYPDEAAQWPGAVPPPAWGQPGFAGPPPPGMPQGAAPPYAAYGPPPQGYPPAGGGPVCPRCGSTRTQKGNTPTWAIVTAIVGFFVVCFLSLLFLIAKDDNVCFNCGMHWK